MSLGETIFRLRTEKSLSQGNLAEMLGVSRQSISKWENNSAVPDLDKIIKLSEIFEVSLDELVKGEEAPRRIIAEAETVPEEKTKEAGFPPRKIAGTILFCMSFLVVMFFFVAGAGLAGLIFALPFLSCGILCFVLKKNVGLWCAWDVFILFDIYMAYATGISRASVLHTLQWTYEMNYMRLAIAWVSVLGLVGMIVITVVRFGKNVISESKIRKQLIMSWTAFVVLQVIAMTWGRTVLHQYIVKNLFELGMIYRLITIFLSWSRIIAVTIALVNTMRFLHMKKQIAH